LIDGHHGLDVYPAIQPAPSRSIVFATRYGLSMPKQKTLEKGVFFASLKVIGKLAVALQTEPAEFLAMPKKSARSK
jgi:hypothetical protein